MDWCNTVSLLRIYWASRQSLSECYYNAAEERSVISGQDETTHHNLLCVYTLALLLRCHGYKGRYAVYYKILGSLVDS